TNDPWTNRVTADVVLGQTPNAAAVDGDSAWVANAEGTVSRIDLTSHHLTTIGTGGQPMGIAVQGGVVWVLDIATANLISISSVSGAIESRVPLPFGTWLASDDHSIWITDHGATGGDVLRFDLATETIVASKRLTP